MSSRAERCDDVSRYTVLTKQKKFDQPRYYHNYYYYCVFFFLPPALSVRVVSAFLVLCAEVLMMQKKPASCFSDNRRSSIAMCRLVGFITLVLAFAPQNGLFHSPRNSILLHPFSFSHLHSA